MKLEYLDNLYLTSMKSKRITREQRIDRIVVFSGFALFAITMFVLTKDIWQVIIK
jgi:hypothetical protein